MEFQREVKTFLLRTRRTSKAEVPLTLAVYREERGRLALSDRGNSKYALDAPVKKVQIFPKMVTPGVPYVPNRKMRGFFGLI